MLDEHDYEAGEDMSDFNVEVKGIERLTANLDKFGKEILKNVGAAGAESANDVILKTRGLRRYPPATDANRPPTPYYIRGKGTQTSKGNKDDSERYGSQEIVNGTHNDAFDIKRRGMDTVIGNRASYAPYLGGEQQAAWAAKKGWRKLREVAEEKISQIRMKYEAWVEKTIRDLGL